MIASTWYCIAQTSTFDTGCTINVAFDGYDIQFSASVRFGMSAINITRCNIPYDTVFSLRLREGASQWFVDIFCNKEITPNVTIADSPYWAEGSTTAGEGNVILVLNDISSKYNTEQGGGTGGLDIDQLKRYLDDNGYTEAKNFWSKEGNETIRTRHNIVVDKGGAFGRGSETNITFGRLDNWEDWDASTMMFYTLSASLGVNLNERLKYIEQNGSGLNEDDLRQYLTSNNYLQEADIADLRVTVKGLDDILNGNVGGVIDTWNEVVSFLDGYKDSEDLATILSGMNTDIANRVLIEDFEKLEEAVNPLFGYFDANGNANNALKLGGHSADYFATADALNTHIKAFNTYKTTTDERLDELEALWYMDDDGNVHTTHNIVVEGGGAFGMGAESGDVPSGGGIDETQLWNILGQSGTQTIHSSHIPDLSGKYLSTSGGVITGKGYDILTINRTDNRPTLAFAYNGTTVGYLGMTTGGVPMYVSSVGDAYSLYHSGNFNPADYLPLSGGTMTGPLKLTNSLELAYSSTALSVVTPYGQSWFGMMNENFCHIYTNAPAFYMDKPLYVNNGNAVIHSGNIGTQSVNYASSASYATYTKYLEINNSLHIWSQLQYMQLSSQNEYGDNPTGSHCSIIKMGHGDADDYYNRTLAFDFWTNNIYTRNRQEGIASGWDQIAFISSNVASATKLQTARSIWGQSFDGSADVSGNIKLRNDGSDADIGNAYSASNSTMYNRIKLGAGTTGLEYYAGAYSGINSSLVHKFYVSYQNINALSIANNGNVLIGTTEDDGSKLKINGGITATEMIKTASAIVTNFYGNATCGLYPNTWITGDGVNNRLWLYNDYNLALYGSKIELRNNTSLTGQLHITFAKNATDPVEQAIVINSADYASTYAAWPGIGFHIPGSTYATIKFGSDTCFHFMNYTLSGWVDVKVGNLIATGGGSFGSDIRYKDITSYRQLNLETIANAPLFSFRWTDREDKVEHLGTSAQYWLGTQFKDAVNTANKDFFHLDYGALAVGIGISVAREVKEVKTEVELLRDEVRQLKEKLNKYEQVWHN